MMNPLFSYNQSIPRSCNVDPKEFRRAFDFLVANLGHDVIDASLDNRFLNDLSRGRSFYERARLISNLEHVPGFKSVIGSIRDQKGSLWRPAGEWFQLKVAHCLITEHYSLELEKEINGKPRDIVITSPIPINIECKTFLEGTQINDIHNNHSRQLRNQGASMVIHGISLNGGDAREITSMAKISGQQVNFNIKYPDQIKRIYDSLINKDGQAPSCIDTVLALNTFYIGVSIKEVYKDIKSILDNNNFSKLKGFLLVEEKATLYSKPSECQICYLAAGSNDKLSTILKQVEGDYFFS